MSSDFRLGEWVVRPSLNSISQNGATTRLEPKVMEVLVCLPSHAGEAASKETILKTVWTDTFVSDDVLTRSICELRRLLGDDARESRIIETIPKRGYLLMVPIAPLGASAASQVTFPSNRSRQRRPWVIRERCWQSFLPYQPYSYSKCRWPP